jgi:uncharacterized protein
MPKPLQLVRRPLFYSFTAFGLLLGASAWVGLYPMLPRDLGGVESLDGRAERVRVAVAPGDSVDAWYLPGTRPASVLLLHGYARTHSRMWRYGAFLHRAGYGVLAFDARSARAAHRLPTTLGWNELADAQAVLDWLRARQPHGRIGVLGESLGGSVAMMLAARNRDVAAVVEDCGFASGRMALEEASERWAHLPRWPTAPVLRWLEWHATGFDPYAFDVIPAAQTLRHRPVLFIQGLEDNRFSPMQVQELWVAAGSKDPLWLIPDAGHNAGWKCHRALYEQRVMAFFDHALLGRGDGVPAGLL